MKQINKYLDRKYGLKNSQMSKKVHFEPLMKRKGNYESYANNQEDRLIDEMEEDRQVEEYDEMNSEEKENAILLNRINKQELINKWFKVEYNFQSIEIAEILVRKLIRSGVISEEQLFKIDQLPLEKARKIVREAMEKHK